MGHLWNVWEPGGPWDSCKPLPTTPWSLHHHLCLALTSMVSQLVPAGKPVLLGAAQVLGHRKQGLTAVPLATSPPPPLLFPLPLFRAFVGTFHTGSILRPSFQLRVMRTSKEGAVITPFYR